MADKVNELQNPPKDPNSPEAQAFLKLLQQKIQEHRKKMREIYTSWTDEDRNENR